MFDEVLSQTGLEVIPRSWVLTGAAVINSDLRWSATERALKIAWTSYFELNVLRKPGICSNGPHHLEWYHGPQKTVTLFFRYFSQSKSQTPSFFSTLFTIIKVTNQHHHSSVTHRPLHSKEVWLIVRRSNWSSTQKEDPLTARNHHVWRASTRVTSLH